jgi:PAS domain S-box-containing protein
VVLSDRREVDLERLVAALGESEERYRRLVEGAPEAIAVHRDGVLLYVNPAAARLVGEPDPAGLVGRSVVAFAHPDDRAVAAERVRRAALEAAPRVSPIGRLVRPDGRVVEAEIVSIPTIFDGQPAANIVIRDVTDRNRAEAALRFLAEASEILSSSLDYQTTLRTVARLSVTRLGDWCQVYVADDDGMHLRGIAGAHADPSRGHLLDDLLDRFPIGADADVPVARVFRSGVAMLMAEIPAGTLEAIAREPAHRQILTELRPVSSIVVPLAARGRALGAITFVSADPRRRFDADDLVLAEELARRAGVAVDNARLYAEAQRAVRLRDDFLSITSHELRTPVAAVKAQAQLARRRLRAGGAELARVEDSLGRIVERADRLASLVQDLLDVSRSGSGRLSLAVRDVDLAALAREAVARVAEQLPTIPHRFELELPAEGCPVAADGERIAEVLVNLLENAVKYSPGGAIVVSVAPETDGARVSVRDEGSGVPPAMLETIFEPFGRAANAVRGAIEGLGLGLHICRQIVERHGGHIQAESAGEGRGTTVVFWIPGRPVGSSLA